MPVGIFDHNIYLNNCDDYEMQIFHCIVKFLRKDIPREKV